ncbi:glycosyltransferase family 4 protein [Candidatus Poribacteria bacterium]|nr:glycosyltransferase family 4 protein [Candidatus Poribacteria bacterium]
MNICMLFQEYYPSDFRIEKEARTLIGAGHKVFLICQRRKSEPPYETVDGLRIYRVDEYPLRGDLLFFQTLYYNPRRFQRLCEIIDSENIHALHAHDLPTVLTAARAAKKYGLPLVFDMRENYPVGILYWKKRRPWHLLVSNVWLARLAERICIRLADRIIVVSDEQWDRMVSFGAGDKTRIIMNTVDLSFLHANVSKTTPKPLQGFVAVYTGMLNRHRGLDTVISAMPLVRKSVPSARLKVVGDGNTKPELERLTEQLHLNDYVEFLGWADIPTMYGHIQESSVGVIPHRKNPHTDSTIPNKLFDYMALGKPVVASDLKPLRRIITETDCGRIFQPDDPKSCAQALIECSDLSRATAFGKNGQRFVATKYNWQTAANTLLDVYRSL